MATKTITGTGLKQAALGSSLTTEPTSTSSVTLNTSYWNYVLKFTIPTFIGKSTKITIKLKYTAGNIASQLSTGACVLATSNSNFNKYLYNTNVSGVSDSYRLNYASYTFKKSTTATTSIEMTSSKLEGNKSYYILIYQPIGVTFQATSNHIITITYEQPDTLVYIDNGTAFETYECYIDNGTTWEQYAPYIDSGTAFEAYG